MKLKLNVLCCLACLYSVVNADVIELKDGTRIEGKILSENQDSLEIEIGQNEKGTIRRVLIIHSSEVSSWVADREGRMVKEINEEVNRLEGVAYIEQLIKDATDEIDQGNYDRGIIEYGEAADLAIEKLGTLTPEQQVEALEVRVHALNLQLAALEGAEESIDSKTDGVEDRIRDLQKKLERDIDDYKKDKEDYDEEMNDRSKQLGNRYKKTELQEREDALVNRKNVLDQQSASVAARLKEFEAEKIKLTTQMKLVEEKVERSEDDLKSAERRLRRR